MSTHPQTGLWTMGKGEFEKSVQALEAAIGRHKGNPRALFDRLRTDNSFADRIAEHMLRNGFEPSTETKLARLVLGRNIFTDADWTSYYDAKFTKRQLRDAGKFPWGEDILSAPCPFNADKTVKETHFAFLGLPNLNGKRITVLGWHELHPATGQPKFYFSQNPWYADQPYAVEPTCNARWYLMLKDIVPGSEDKTSEEQEAMLPPEYEIPTTIEEVAKDMLVFRKTDVRPNQNRWARCKEKTVKTAQASGGRFSCVGHFDEVGLRLGSWDGFRLCIFGVGASRKFPS